MLHVQGTIFSSLRFSSLYGNPQRRQFPLGKEPFIGGRPTLFLSDNSLGLVMSLGRFLLPGGRPRFLGASSILGFDFCFFDGFSEFNSSFERLLAATRVLLNFGGPPLVVFGLPFEITLGINSRFEKLAVSKE